MTRPSVRRSFQNQAAPCLSPNNDLNIAGGSQHLSPLKIIKRYAKMQDWTERFLAKRDEAKEGRDNDKTKRDAKAKGAEWQEWFVAFQSISLERIS
jgi:hypothetical protein